jgi:hypothetical protein
VTLVADTGQAVVVRVDMQDGSGRSDDIVLTYAAPGAVVSTGPYRFDGRVAVIRRGAQNQLQSLFVYGATFLQDTARNLSLAADLDPNLPFEQSVSP